MSKTHRGLFLGFLMMAPGVAQPCVVAPGGTPDGWDPVIIVAGLPCPGVRPCRGHAFVNCPNGAAPAPALPMFPAINIAGSFMCSEACQPADTGFAATVTTLQPLFFAACDTTQANVTITAGTMSFTGVMNVKYARTWKLTTTPGLPGDTIVTGQVWRFLVNADLNFTAADADPCPFPPCSGSGPVHWVGHIDYRCGLDDPMAPEADWAVALSLSHLPGVVSHNASSTRPVAPGSDHVFTSYHLVAPAPFTWFPPNTPPSSTGPAGVLGETVRKDVTGMCVSREHPILPAVGTGATLSDPLCTGTPPWWDMRFASEVRWCGMGMFNPIANSEPCGAAWPGGAANPGAGIIGVALGEWTNPPIFPSNQRLSLYWGCMTYDDPNSQGNPPLRYFRDFVTGVATEDTIPDLIMGPAPWLVELFPFTLAPDPGSCCLQVVGHLDLQNSRIAGINAWGSVFTADFIYSLILR